MSVVFIVLPLALVLAGAAVAAFAWALRGGQMDDLETPSVRILVEDGDDRPSPAPTDAAEPDPEAEDA